MSRLFSGIDPFTEAQHYWPDFHNSTITCLRNDIADHLPDLYDVRAEERINLVEYPAGLMNGGAIPSRSTTRPR